MTRQEKDAYKELEGAMSEAEREEETHEILLALHDWVKEANEKLNILQPGHGLEITWDLRPVGRKI